MTCTLGGVSYMSVNTAIRFVLLLSSLLFSASLIAAGLESTDPDRLGERPNAQGPATEVSIGLFLFDVDEIDDVHQRFSVDLFVDVTWQDERLALPEAERTGQLRTFPMDEIWTPRLLVVNDRGLTAQLPRLPR